MNTTRTDKNRTKAVNPAQPVLRGQMAKVLCRFLGEHTDAEELNRAQLELLWDRAAQLDPAIGLHLFSKFKANERFILVDLALCSATVGEGLQHWQRFYRLGSDLHLLRAFQENGQLIMEVRVEGSERLRRHFSEHTLVVTMTQLREGCLYPVTPLCAEFAYPRPPYHEEYMEWFGPHVRFDCPQTRLVFDESILDFPNRGHHPVLAEMIVSGLERRMARLHQFSGLAADVAKRIRFELEHGMVPSLESAADALHLTSRTLRRRLQAESLNYRQILTAVRIELEQYLELQGMDRESIASRLGYSDIVVYLRARKSWRDPSAN